MSEQDEDVTTVEGIRWFMERHLRVVSATFNKFGRFAPLGTLLLRVNPETMEPLAPGEVGLLNLFAGEAGLETKDLFEQRMRTLARECNAVAAI